MKIRNIQDKSLHFLYSETEEGYYAGHNEYDELIIVEEPYEARHFDTKEEAEEHAYMLNHYLGYTFTYSTDAIE